MLTNIILANQNIVFRPAAPIVWMSPGNLLEMQNIRCHTGLLNYNLHFYKISVEFIGIFMFEKYWSKIFSLHSYGVPGCHLFSGYQQFPWMGLTGAVCSLNLSINPLSHFILTKNCKDTLILILQIRQISNLPNVIQLLNGEDVLLLGPDWFPSLFSFHTLSCFFLILIMSNCLWIGE